MKTTEVFLYKKLDTGRRDKTNRPITEEVAIRVEGVLVAPVSIEEVITTVNLTGKKAIYQIAIPKGDDNDWDNAKVLYNGKFYRTIGIPEEGMDENIPLKWNRKIKVERYE